MDTGRTRVDKIEDKLGSLGLDVDICNKYCQQARDNMGSTLNKWLQSSGINDTFNSRSHCVDTILDVGDTIKEW